MLEDETNQLTIDQVRSKRYIERFYSTDMPVLNIGLSDSTFWIKVSLSYPNVAPNIEMLKDWYLEVASTQLDVAELYLPDLDGQYIVQSSDVRTRHKNRSIRHINSVFPITLHLGEEITLFLKLEKSTSMRLPLTLWTPKGFIEKIAIEEFTYGLFYGSMLILLVYNAFLYFSVRDESYLYYVLYLGGVTIFELLEVGHGLIHVEEYFGAIDREYIVFIIWEITLASAYFGKIFMSLKETHPKLNSILNMFLAIAIASFFVSLLFDYKISVNWAASYNSIFMPTYIGVALYLWMNGSENAKYFFLAWIANVIGFLIFTGVTYQILPANALTFSATPVGIIVEAITLSFALANRIKNEQAGRIKSDRDTIEYMARYQSVFNNAREGMYEMTIKGRLLHANPSMVDLFGFETLKDLMKSDLAVANILFENPPQQFYELLEKGGTSSTLRLQNGNKKTVWVAHKAKIIRDVNGRKSHVEGVVHNITQQKLKNIAIIQRETEVNEKKIAEESMRKKGEFLSNMNHEIRTPLTAIIGFSESLTEPNMTATERRDTVNVIVNNSRALLQLINDILDYSKLDADKFYIENVSVETGDIVEGIKSKYTDIAKEKGINFFVVYQYPIPSITLGDPTRILQILENLCSNAIKFTDAGSVTLKIGWNGALGEVKYEVADSGLGINKVDQERLFEVFDQADASSSRRYGGAGLALAVSKKLATLMNGDIVVASELGKGSTFTFTVPAEIPADTIWVRKEKVSKRRDMRRKNHIPRLHGTVLLAEDNVVNQKLIERILCKSGVNVIIASDGIEVCQVCDDILPDFVLMDINMPNRNGLEATRYLRRQEYNVPIYALTAESSKEEIDKTLEAGCNGFLGKPLNKDLLYSAMERHLPKKA